MQYSSYLKYELARREPGPACLLFPGGVARLKMEFTGLPRPETPAARRFQVISGTHDIDAPVR